MKHSKLGLLLLAAAISFIPLLPRTAQAATTISFEYFYDSLDPYGEWIELPEYGYCWRPSNVDEEWAPYTDGYWANTDAGWTWVSYEDWGGITYHYGRWARVPGEGWIWVPDYEWAPAWVSWRSSDDYVGWAPLPPRARWRPQIGISFWVDDYCDIGPTYYNFCEVRHFGSPALRPVIIDRRRNVTVINQTTNITNITVNRTTNIIYNGGPSYTTISQKSIRPIQTLKLHQQSDVGDWRNNRGPTMARQRGNELYVIAPKVDASTATTVRPQRVARVLPQATVDTGWAGVSDPKERQKIHAKIKKESKNLTPEQAPATPPSEQEIKTFEKVLTTQPTQPNPATGSQTVGAPGKVKPGVKPDQTPGTAVVQPTQPTNPQTPAGVDPAVPSATPQQNPKNGNGRKGKHGEVTRPGQLQQQPQAQPQQPQQSEQPIAPDSRPQQSNQITQPVATPVPERPQQRDRKGNSKQKPFMEQPAQPSDNLKDQPRIPDQTKPQTEAQPSIPAEQPVQAQERVQEQQRRAREQQAQQQQREQIQAQQRAQEQQARSQEQALRRQQDAQREQAQAQERAQVQERVQEQQRRARELQAQQQQQREQIQAQQRAQEQQARQEQAVRRQQEAQAQQRQQMQAEQRAQEQQQRAQEQAMRRQQEAEARQRRSEQQQSSRSVERAPQIPQQQQQVAVPSDGGNRKNKKDKDKDQEDR